MLGFCQLGIYNCQIILTGCVDKTLMSLMQTQMIPDLFAMSEQICHTVCLLGFPISSFFTKYLLPYVSCRCMTRCVSLWNTSGITPISAFVDKKNAPSVHATSIRVPHNRQASTHSTWKDVSPGLTHAWDNDNPLSVASPQCVSACARVRVTRQVMYMPMEGSRLRPSCI